MIEESTQETALSYKADYCFQKILLSRFELEQRRSFLFVGLVFPKNISDPTECSVFSFQPMTIDK